MNELFSPVGLASQFLCLGKFQLDVPINTMDIAVQSLENPIHLCWSGNIGGQKNPHKPIFPYNITENYPTSLAHNSVLMVEMTSNLVQRHFKNPVFQATPKFSEN